MTILSNKVVWAYLARIPFYLGRGYIGSRKRWKRLQGSVLVIVSF